jgi:hypothetical protein
MARAVSHRAAAGSSSDAATGLPRLLRWPIATVRGLLFNHAYFPMLLALVLLGEAVLGSLIIQRIACTDTRAEAAAEQSSDSSSEMSGS